LSSAGRVCAASGVIVFSPRLTFADEDVMDSLLERADDVQPLARLPGSRPLRIPEHLYQESPARRRPEPRRGRPR
jgi:hypothetical protein